MKKFLIYYWVNLGLLFGLFYWDVSPISLWFNPLQTDVTVWLTSLTLPVEWMHGYEIMINPHYSLIIEKACNGIVPYLFLMASIFAFPATYTHKIKWAIYGYVAIISINILRIWLVTQFVLESQENFSLAHDYIGNALVIAVALLLFILFVKTRSKLIYSKVESSNSLRKNQNPMVSVSITSSI